MLKINGKKRRAENHNAKKEIVLVKSTTKSVSSSVFSKTRG